MLGRLTDKIMCKLGKHPQVVLQLVSPEFVRPEVWRGECSLCGATVEIEREEEPMIPESERIEAAQGDPIEEPQGGGDIVWDED